MLKSCIKIFIGVCIFIWVWCKVLGFRIVPSSMIIPAPKKFEFPKIRKNAEGEWVSEESENESSDEDDDDSDDEDDDFY